MDYLVTLNGQEKIGTVPTPEELQSLIKAALAAVPEYQVFDIEVRSIGVGTNLAGDRNIEDDPKIPSWIRSKITKIA